MSTNTNNTFFVLSRVKIKISFYAPSRISYKNRYQIEKKKIPKKENFVFAF